MTKSNYAFEKLVFLIGVSPIRQYLQRALKMKALSACCYYY